MGLISCHICLLKHTWHCIVHMSHGSWRRSQCNLTWSTCWWCSANQTPHSAQARDSWIDGSVVTGRVNLGITVLACLELLNGLTDLCILCCLMCRLSEAVSSEDSVAFLQAAAGGLAPGQAPPVQIGACRAIVQLSQRTTGASLQPHLPHIYSGQLYMQSCTRPPLHLLTCQQNVFH